MNVIKYLADNGISSKIYFHPVHQSKFYKNEFDWVNHITAEMNVVR